MTLRSSPLRGLLPFWGSSTLWTVALGLSAAISAPAQAPVTASADKAAALTQAANQQMADAIANCLRASQQLKQFTVEIAYHDGIAELKGKVLDPLQHLEVIRLVRSVPGVTNVHDALVIGEPIQPVQALAPTAPPPAVPIDQSQAQPIAAPVNPGTPIPVPMGGPMSVPMGTPTGMPGGMMPAEPMPIMQAPPQGTYAGTQPKMPPYAWPTYAPYNNYSRVAYPTRYPYHAWPYIGPFHPFPKVPPGWRKVQLEWQDGYWWYSTRGMSRDWWTLRYW